MKADRVLLLNRWFAPETFGGTETTICDLGKTFHDMGLDVTVVCETRSLSTGWTTESDLRVFRHPGREVPDFAWSLRPAATYLNAVRWLRTLAPEIGGRPIIARTPLYAAAARHVFPHEWITYWAPGSRPWFGLFQGKTDLTRRERFWNWFDATQNSFVRRRALRGANIVVAEARHVADDLIERLRVDPAKVRLRGNGVDLKRFRPRPYDAALAAELDIPEGSPIVLGAARLEPMKNFQLLIRAFARMHAADATLVLVGDGTEAPALRHLVEQLGIGRRVRFAGWRLDVERFYSLATVYVLPSIYEPYGNAYAEALASGAPTIGVRPAAGIFVGGGEHIVEGENGYFVDAYDSSELAGTLDRIVTTPSLQTALARSAREIAARRYNWHATASEFLDELRVH
jgi:glycosyltransferase involved in cell wall biosynthesis